MPELIRVTRQKDNRFILHFEMPDRVGALSLITGLLTSYGIDIERGTVDTVEKTAKNTLEVKAPKSVDWKKVSQELDQIVRRVERGELPAVRSEINRRIIHLLRARKQTPEDEDRTQVDLSIDQASSPHAVIVDIRALDSPAFLYELSYALSALNINIVRTEVETEGGRIRDRLWVTDPDGKKITSQDKIRAIQWTVLLMKQFSERVPKVPDPAEAFEKIVLIGKDIFARKDFDATLLTLRKSEALDSLSTVLGTSRYLWEEFIRAQQSTMVEMLGNHRLLALRKQKSLMKREIGRLIRSKGGFDAKADALNEYKDREMFRIDLRHLLGKTSYVDEFAEEFSDLAEVVIETTLVMSWEEVLQRRPHPMCSKDSKSRLTVFALGKLGGREVGFASDMELLFVYSDDPDSAGERSIQNQEFYTELVRSFLKIIRARSEGVFEIDLRLRPHGKAGPLASSADSFKTYYAPDGPAWSFERQALIRLRPVAGSVRVGEDILAWRDKYVFGPAPLDIGEALRLRKKQREELVTAGTVNAKYSAGGLLDVEYLTQTLQIVFGAQSLAEVRSVNTIRALQGLRFAGVLGEEAYRSLNDSYIFLRDLINALRMVRGNARDLTIPPRDSNEFTLLARRMGYGGEDESVAGRLAADIARYMSESEKRYALEMDRLARGEKKASVDVSVSRPEALSIYLDSFLRGALSVPAAELLHTVGFQNPSAVLVRLQRMAPPPNTRVFASFRQAIYRSWSVWPRVANPDLALHHLEQFAEAHAEADMFWRTAASSEEHFPLLLKLFGVSRYLSETMIAHPQYWTMFHRRALRGFDDMRTRIAAGLKDASLETIREIRHRETLCIAMAELFDDVPLADVFGMFSSLTEKILQALYETHLKKFPVCVLGLGKLGARELNFSSDVDLVFVSSDGTRGSELIPLLQRYVKCLSEGELEQFLYRVDLRLRPHGGDGALFLTEKDYMSYYEKGADAWEYQALLKLRPVAGACDLGERIVSRLSSHVYRAKWADETWTRLKKIKGRYEAINRSRHETDTNIKMGPGGIRDIEFAVQAIQLRYGALTPELREPNTLRALDSAVECKRIDKDDYASLRDGYLFLRRIENRLHLYENRQVFNIPEDMVGLRWLRRGVGFFDTDSVPGETAFRDALKTTKQRCRAIFERIFFEAS